MTPSEARLLALTLIDQIPLDEIQEVIWEETVRHKLTKKLTKKDDMK